MFFKIVNNHNAKIQNDELTEFILDSNIAGVKIAPTSQDGLTEPYYYEIQYKRASAHNGFGIASLDHDWSTNLFIPYDKTGKVLSVGYNGSSYGQITYNPVTDDVIGVDVDTVNKIMKVYINNVFHHERTIPFDNLNSFIFSCGSNATTTDYAHIKLLFDKNEQIYQSPSNFSSVYFRTKLLLKSNNKIYSLKSKEILHETKMTSNTAPSPLVASASSIYSSTFPAWKAFNGTAVDTNDCWMSKETKSGYLIIDFGESKKINNFKITPRNDTTYYLTNSPKEFSILGSQDGVIYEELGTFENVTDWEINKAKDFTLNKVFNFRFYKLNIIDNNGAVSTAIGELLFSYAETVTQTPSDSVDSFIRYGSSSIENFNLINTNKNYILQDTVSENTDGLWVQDIDRKPLSIKFE